MSKVSDSQQCEEIHPDKQKRCELKKGHKMPHYIKEFVQVTDREQEFLDSLTLRGKHVSRELWETRLKRGRGGMNVKERLRFDELVEKYHATEEP